MRTAVLTDTWQRGSGFPWPRVTGGGGANIGVFPAAALPLGVELLLNGSWVDITPYVYQRDQIRITRGRANEGSTADAATCQLTLDNRDGRFSRRNPNGPWYGVLGRNTQIRVFILDPNLPWARQYRFWGEVPEWPVKWDTTGTDVYAQITASGIMRRLGQGASPLKSAYYRGTTGSGSPITALRAYWPLEDGAGATTLASGLSSGKPMTIVGTPVLADDSTNFVCSAPLPTMGTARFIGTVPSYTATNYFQVRFLVAIPSTGTTNNAIVCRVLASGTAQRYDLYYQTGGGGALGLKVYDATGTLLRDTTAIAFAPDGTTFRMSIQASVSGSDIAISIVTINVGATSGSAWNDTVTGATVGRVTGVEIATQKDMAGVTIGHVTVQSTVDSAYANSDQLHAYSGETAAARVARLCDEEDITSVITSATGTTTGEVTMGYQLQKTLLELIRECETADGGILSEPRDNFGIAYRTRDSLQSQAADLALSYTAFDLSEIDPTEDDQNLVNDATATRPGGSSARYVLSSGALSTAAAPNGVGVYDVSSDVNVERDDQLADQASWRVHLGTVDEPRFPSLGIDFSRTNFAISTPLNVAAATADLGDRVTVSSPPAWLPPDTISQLIIGTSETLDSRTHTLGMVCEPESPYHVAVWSDLTDSRYTSDGSTLSGVHSSTTTSLTVVTASGLDIWTHGDGDFDILVNGERMTVTAVAGGSSPQTFTVTRSVNGIANVLPDGATVELFHPTYWGL